MFNLVGIRGNTQRTARRGVRNDTFGVSLFASLVIHVLVILLGSNLVRDNNKSRQHDYFPIDLVEVPTREVRCQPKKSKRHLRNQWRNSKRRRRLRKLRALSRNRRRHCHRPKKIRQNRSKPSRLRRQNSSLLQALLPQRPSRAAAAKPAQAIFLAKGMLASFPVPAPPAGAAAQLLQDWDVALARQAYRRSQFSKPTAKPNQFKSCALPIRQWRCAPASKAMWR